MKVDIPGPAAAGIAVVVLAVVLGFGWMRLNDNGERPNPNAGKPNKELMKKITVQNRGSETKEEYASILRSSRPDLSDAEIQTKTDAWWNLVHPGGIEASSAAPANSEFSRHMH